jgi:hypothetical protein
LERSEKAAAENSAATINATGRRLFNPMKEAAAKPLIVKSRMALAAKKFARVLAGRGRIWQTDS